jgi:hypothetical protein
MSSLFNNNQFVGIAVFVDPQNTVNLLNELSKDYAYFFYFNNERGFHLRLFFKAQTQKEIEKIYEKIRIQLQNFPKSYQSTTEKGLFENFPPHTINPIHFIEPIYDLHFSSSIADKDFINFLHRFCSILVRSLNSNDFFLEEDNRLNFSLQLLFLPLSKSEIGPIIKHLKKTSDESNFKKTFERNQVAFVNFFTELKNEDEKQADPWVKEWITISRDLLKKNATKLLIEAVCRVLNIEKKQDLLTYIVRETLRNEN